MSLSREGKKSNLNAFKSWYAISYRGSEWLRGIAAIDVRHYLILVRIVSESERDELCQINCQLRCAHGGDVKSKCTHNVKWRGEEATISTNETKKCHFKLHFAPRSIVAAETASIRPQNNNSETFSSNTDQGLVRLRRVFYHSDIIRW